MELDKTLEVLLLIKF